MYAQVDSSGTQRGVPRISSVYLYTHSIVCIYLQGQTCKCRHLRSLSLTLCTMGFSAFWQVSVNYRRYSTDRPGSAPIANLLWLLPALELSCQNSHPLWLRVFMKCLSRRYYTDPDPTRSLSNPVDSLLFASTISRGWPLSLSSSLPVSFSLCTFLLPFTLALILSTLLSGEGTGITAARLIRQLIGALSRKTKQFLAIVKLQNDKNNDYSNNNNSWGIVKGQQVDRNFAIIIVVV